MTDNKNTLVGLVLVTHGNLALEFISAMQHVVGKQEKVAAVCIGPEDDMEMRRQGRRSGGFDRHVRRNAFQSGNFDYGSGQCGNYRRG